MVNIHSSNKDGTEIFNCQYNKGKKSGTGFEILNGGWKLEGEWKNNEFEGKNNTFIYPDGTKIIGEVEDGEYINGHYISKDGKKIKTLKVDIANRDNMPEHKMDKDPYESKYLTVK